MSTKRYVNQLELFANFKLKTYRTYLLPQADVLLCRLAKIGSYLPILPMLAAFNGCAGFPSLFAGVARAGRETRTVKRITKRA